MRRFGHFLLLLYMLDELIKLHNSIHVCGEIQLQVLLLWSGDPHGFPNEATTQAVESSQCCDVRMAAPVAAESPRKWERDLL